MARIPRTSPEGLLLGVGLAGLAAGSALHLGGADRGAHVAWAATAAVGLGPAVWWVLDAARHRRMGADVVAVLALVGTLVVGEELAGALITVMLASGRVLELRAGRRARRDLHELLARAPRVAHRYEGDQLADGPPATVRRGDLLLVRPGEVVPVDGLVERGVAVLDESALTGEPVPAERAAGEQVRSGTVNAGAAFDLRATTTEPDSTYAGIVRLVSEIEADTAPFVRLADRYAGVFLVVALAAATGAGLAAGDLGRSVAVLVVATPCPLILAVPVAVVGGLSRAARRGIVVKGGGALEALADVRTLLVDKTGTLTVGRPTLADIRPADGADPDEVLRAAASLEQVSPHVLAAAAVRAARERGLALTLPRDVEEVPGQGARGRVGEHLVTVGRAEWVAPEADPAWLRAVRRHAEREGVLGVFVAQDDRVVGALLFADPVRPDAARTVRRLHRDGIRRIVMVTGDREEVARGVGAVLGVDEVLAERTPAEKVEAVRIARRSGPTAMVGDGVNDAPALARADVGIALGARGSGASSEAADVVLAVDRLDRVGEAVVIARRTRLVARQAVLLGILLSLAAMGLAAVGLLRATWGALLQEAIDVAAILVALRALRPASASPRLVERDGALARRFAAEHLALRPDVDRLRQAADALGVAPMPEALARVRDVHRLLVEEILPHEEAEDAELYPVLARVLGGDDPTGTMSRAHLEIAHLVRRLGRVLDRVSPDGPDQDDVVELRRLLYGLHAVLALHFAQEDEGYLSLADDVDAAAEAGAGDGGRPVR